MATTSPTDNNPEITNDNDFTPSPPPDLPYLASLRRHFPKVAEEWHLAKNETHFFQKISNTSRRAFWWKCSNDASHEWQASPYDRTVNLRGDCPYCRYSLEKWFPRATIDYALSVKKELFSRNLSQNRDLPILLAIIDYKLRFKGHFLPSSKIRQIAKHNHSSIDLVTVRQYHKILRQHLPLLPRTNNYLRNFVTGIFSQEIVKKLLETNLSPASVLTTSINFVDALQRSKYFSRDYELVAWGCVLLSMRFYRPDISDRELILPLCGQDQLQKVLATKYRLINRLKEFFTVEKLTLQLFQVSTEDG